MNNFQIFNASLNNALTDSQYTNSQDRINGVLGELAKSTVHNKLYAQTSIGVYALAKFVADHGRDALDRDPAGFADNIALVILDLINGVVSDRVPNTRASSTAYAKGDVVDSPYIPKWGELECIQAGTSANTDVINGVAINAIGQQINDGTVVWAIRAKRFHTLLNVPIPFSGNWSTPILIGEPSYPIHPEIGLPMWDCRLCDGTNGTIDMRNRFLMASDKANANQTGGSDNFSIKRENLPTDNFGLSLTCNNWEKTLSGSFSTNEHDDEHTHTYGIDVGDVTQVMGFSPGIGVRMLGNRTLVTGGINTGGDPNKKKHNHSVKVEFDVTHKHNISGTVKLNSNAQQKISIVSRHYKLAYIQRIY